MSPILTDNLPEGHLISHSGVWHCFTLTYRGKIGGPEKPSNLPWVPTQVMGVLHLALQLGIGAQGRATLGKSPTTELCPGLPCGHLFPALLFLLSLRVDCQPSPSLGSFISLCGREQSLPRILQLESRHSMAGLQRLRGAELRSLIRSHSPAHGNRAQRPSPP